MRKESNIKQFHIRIFIVLIATLVFYSCEEKTDWTLQESEAFIVVDAIISNEFKQQEVKVYWSNTEINQLPEPISGAEILLSDGLTIYEFTESPSSVGLYYSNPFAVTIDKVYYLVINYNGFSDTARAIIGADYILPFSADTIIFQDSLYKYIYADSDDPAMIEVYYDWSHNTEYCNSYGSCFASETFYTLNIIDVGQEFAPPKQEILFPIGTTITRRKYSLNSAHQEFIRSLLIETEWRGGIFDIEQGNVPTNFRNGARGWFGVCLVLEETDTFE
ncbi:MAG: DUF4249 family protein [Salinivirgaceae bacterium]|nr:DUF4249 family protein [Salinivirgaceae bacterium]